ncbi:MAG: hypothetical protein JXB32_12565 [Deltaproteobacteria bacterium]|nr:hypothetical protein [Deltaproteobacteria bacterium]
MADEPTPHDEPHAAKTDAEPEPSSTAAPAGPADEVATPNDVGTSPVSALPDEAPPPPPAAPAVPKPPPGPSRLLRLWAWGRTPLVLFLASFLVFSLFSWNRFWHRSTDPHFVLLANAFLKGTVEIRKQDVPKGVPSPLGVGADRHDNDWASWEELPLKGGEVLRGNFVEGSEYEAPHRFETLDGRLLTITRDEIDTARSKDRKRHYFVSFPPAPAVLMMPLALIQGYDVNDVRFTLFFAAFNVALCFVLLRRLRRLGVTERKPWENVFLALALGFATTHLWCAVLGQVWFTALVLGVTGTLFYVLACTDLGRPWLAGLALAFCMAIRPQLAAGGLLFAALLLFPEGRWRRTGWGDTLRKLALFAVPLVVVGVLLLWYNHVRFEDPTKFGHEFLQAGKLDRIVKWGLFNYHFFPINLTAMLTTLPQLSRDFPYIKFSLHGMSVFLAMPFLVYLVVPCYPEGDRTTWLWHRALWAGTLVLLLPGLLYQNTGWEQYGFRFAMDWLVYIMLLLALSRRRLSRLFVTLTVVGFLVNAWGAIAFKRGAPFDAFFDTWLVP